MSLRPDTTGLAPVAAVETVATARSTSPRLRLVRRLLRKRGTVLAIAFLMLVAIAAIFGTAVAPHDPNAQDILNSNDVPSWSHPFGTDDLGRDILSRLIVGARISVRISLQTVLLAGLIALPIGLVSGYIGGRLDNLLMRIVDAMLAFPPLVLAIAVAGLLGKGVGNVALAITIVMVPGFARLVRASTLAVKEETFVEASRSIGTRTRRILSHRILPNVRSPLIVGMSLAFGAAILAEAGLSFLGLSQQPPNASWGNMLRRAYDHSLYTHPWQLWFPGAVIALMVLAYNTLGDALRDALSASQWVPTRDHHRKPWQAWNVLQAWQQRQRKTRRGLTAVTRIEVPAAPDPAPLLAVEHLSLEFDTEQGRVRVVDDVSFSVASGEVLGLVGESGSGKTVTSLAIMRLLGSPPARIAEGAVYFEGRDLFALSFDEMRAIRGAELSMVFQDPMTSLNPAYTIGDQLREALRLHEHVDRATARARAREMLDLVQIPAPEQRLHEYPHQLSGGMRQRVMLAIALMCRPKLLIADEPTTALDVTIQAQMLDLLRSLQRELDLSVIFVTHDLGVVADICDRVAVMYSGQIVEQGTVGEVFTRPQQPYTEGLLAAMPQTGRAGDALYVIPGQVPHPRAWPGGCRFHPRCAYVIDACRSERVSLTAGPNGAAGPTPHDVRCLRSGELDLRGSQ
ncbi:MAG: dipeptide/oligopeptide/nickel ABC transporter permease/ATP-binding protein [Actinobacteria bacterium]|nr:dipeptide/oligopeptide/nickel ABC transporter permease/ATP-binding protein [Actinomycetota bacterium]